MFGLHLRTPKIHGVHSKHQKTAILRKCCGSPGPQGGAHSTDTGPAHEPTAGSLPATENKIQMQQHREERTSLMYPICAV